MRSDAMKEQSKPLEFLVKSQRDPKLKVQVRNAVQKGGMVTAAEVMRIARAAGYSFTKEEFEQAVKASIAKRFAAGESGLATVINAADPPESSCAKGCLSYTTSWHPDPPAVGPATDPLPAKMK
jgi:hypothetical protein